MGMKRTKIASLVALGALLLGGAVAGVAVGAGRDTPSDTTTASTDTATTTSTAETTTIATTTTVATTTTPTTTTVPPPAVPAINYGVADDAGKYADDGGAWFDSMLKGANLTEVRWTLAYNGDPNTITELPFIQ